MSMRRIQIYIEEGVDDRLGALARERGVSKSSVIRDAIAKEVGPASDQPEDPRDRLIGCLDGEEDPKYRGLSIDEVVYGFSASGRKYGE